MLTHALALIAFAFADPAPTVDQLVERVASAQKAVKEAREKEATVTKELQAAIAALNTRLRELGVGPATPEPIDPPRPVDPLTVAVRAAYVADASPADAAKKAEALKDLVEVYKQAQTFARTMPEVVVDPVLGERRTTVAAVIAKVKAAATAVGLTATDLVAVRKVIAAELLTAFPADAALDAAGRDKLAAAFARIFAALSAVTP